MPEINQQSDYNFEVLFENLPDWAIPMMHIIPVFYTEDGIEFDKCDFFYDFDYDWIKVDEINYKLFIRISGRLQQIILPSVIIHPLYVDINCYFLNERKFYSIQHQKH